MQFDADTKATSHCTHLVTLDTCPETEVEDDAEAEAQELLRQYSSSGPAGLTATVSGRHGRLWLATGR